MNVLKKPLLTVAKAVLPKAPGVQTGFSCTDERLLSTALNHMMSQINVMLLEQAAEQVLES